MKKIIVLLCAILLLSLTGCDQSSQYVPDVRNLQWGMTEEEVVQHETSKDYTKEIGDGQILLTYEDIDLYGYDSQLVLCVENSGLSGVNYRIYEDIYQELYDISVAEYGEPDEGEDGIYAIWSISEKGYDIYLLGYYTDYVQYSYFPIVDKSTDSDIGSSIEYFSEVPNMRKPSAEYGMTYNRYEDNIYIYGLSQDTDAAEAEVQMYLAQLITDGFDVDVDGNNIMVYNDGKLMAFMSPVKDGTELVFCISFF